MARNAIIISIFLCITYCSCISGLSPKAFDSFKGYPFCSYGTAAQFKQMCLKMANQLGYAAFDESYLNNLSCEQKTVWLKADAEDAQWETREPYLLECIYYWKNDTGAGSSTGSNDKPTIIKQYISDGVAYEDVYRFSPDNKGNLTGDQNYRNFLKSIFKDL